MSIRTKTLANKMTISAKVVATVIAIVAAVALPQTAHIMGAITGTGNAFGATFLPMHLPVLAVGLLAGPMAGLVTGFISPLLSYMMTGMPAVAVLPFMMLELASYGFFAGLFYNRTIAGKKLPAIVSVFGAQLAGRLVRFGALLVCTSLLGITAIAPISVFTAIPEGLYGIVVQLLLLPAVMKVVSRD